MKKAAIILGNIFAGFAVAGFCLMVVSAIQTWFNRHENPEGIISPMGLALVSVCFSAFAWRLTASRRYAWLGAAGLAFAVVVIGIESAMY